MNWVWYQETGKKIMEFIDEEQDDGSLKISVLQGKLVLPLTEPYIQQCFIQEKLRAHQLVMF